MEEHFLADKVSGEQSFNPEPWYNPVGDCIIYQVVDEAVVGDRVDEVLTIYRSAVSGEPIGFQIKDVAAIISRCGVDGMAITSEDDGTTLISVGAIVLAAYEGSLHTIHRRQAYASVLPYVGASIPLEQISSRDLIDA